MCYIALSLGAHPEFPFILAANRDEFYGRPSLTINQHFSEGIWAGKDAQGGGTWLGFNENGQFGILTNFHENKFNPKAPTRGRFIIDFLESDSSSHDFVLQQKERADEFNGYSLLVGDSKGLHYFNNRSKESEHITEGVHILSNGFLNDNWPKYQKGKRLLEDICKNGQTEVQQLQLQLFKLLQDQERFPARITSPDSFHQEIQKAATSIFVESSIYGTKSSLVVVIDKENRLHFTEWYYPIRDQKETISSNEFTINN